MNKHRKLIKGVLDLAMAVVLALMFNKMAVAGLAFHEIAGLALGLAFVIHQGLNWAWIKNVTLKFFRQGTPAQTRVRYVINVLLLASFAFILVSGLMISKVLLPAAGAHPSLFWKVGHTAVSYLALGLIGVHLGLHGTWIVGLFSRLTRRLPFRNVGVWIARTVAVAVFALGAVNFVSVGYAQKVGGIAVVFADAGASRPDDRAHGVKPAGKGAPTVDTWALLATYGSLLGAFAVPSHYASQLFRRRKGLPEGMPSPSPS